MSEKQTALVQVRTPTYKRPDALRRCLRTLQAQTWQNWVCDVYDDDPQGSAKAVCDELGDRRIFYNRNRPQKFASPNIDQCFSRRNPRKADYFCVAEDDNFILPEFMEENIALCEREGVEIVLRNQLMEYKSGTPEAYLSDFGILDRCLVEGRYEPDLFRLSLIPGIGVSNGGLFWSKSAGSDLEIGYPCNATLQEYMRTFTIIEDIYVAMKPLAVWAQNGEQTTRDLGDRASYLRRELDLKRGIQLLQRETWRLAGENRRRIFLDTDRFRYDRRARARGLVKALIPTRVGDILTWREKLELTARGLLIRTAGSPEDNLEAFIAARTGNRAAGGTASSGDAPETPFS
ncbi:glycosyltransferase family A protein [Chelativorans sp. AA-79]|uniref:glycosyltransferase family A protein n=1 Tax=Chelativorans sp. AA-79 TaxID=3028735 RepID=UPI0023F73EFD|nr:glycosyltransferase family A protein [Chelativorans sp. AA-79]WEX08176.1 glycosyltransferase family A protein [Chelativorans sp. AA-79]